MVTKSPVKSHVFCCESCDIKTNNKKDFTRHLLTAKHVKAITGDKNGDTGDANSPKNQCENCQKIYNSRNGLWKHKKTCVVITPPPTVIQQPAPVQFIYEENKIIKTLVDENKELMNDNKDFKNLILEMMKSNTDLQNKMMEVCKNSNNTIQNSHNNNHSHNKTFNLQFFLNEQCKDAMNIMDFVNSVTLQLSDLESVGQLGYVEGITKIMIKKLTEMDIYKRPVHCSDAKREIIHVKDNDVWEKEDVTYPKLRRAIKYITKKNSDLLLVWSAKYPESKNIYSKVNETYMIMVHQAMGGTGEVTDNENKIIKKISKMILIDK
jgi:hypothetical protein